MSTPSVPTPRAAAPAPPRLRRAPRPTGLPADSTRRAPVSVLVLTYNEEANLPRCLESVAWADDVLVVDSFSTDRTVEIARQYGARVVQRAFDDFAGQRNFGLDEGRLRHDWVLHLDADEVVTDALREELEAVARRAERPAYRLASRMMFQGEWVRRAGMYPTYQVRFGRADQLRFEQVGHGQRETLPAEAVGTLREPLDHYSFSKGLAEWFDKHNRYSTAEAAESIRHEAAGGRLDARALASPDATTRRRALKRVAARMPFRPTLRFLYMYLWHGGVLDGRAGLEYCRLLALYEAMAVAKERELRLQARGVAL